MTWRRWLRLAARSIVAGAVAGLLAGGLIYFGFGVLGLDGGDLLERVANGWRAAVAFGPRRGAVLGVAVSIGLIVAFFLWSHTAGSLDPAGARGWLTVAASCGVVAGNVGRMRTMAGWDEVAVGTVAFMAAVTAVAVWWAAPWVLRSVE